MQKARLIGIGYLLICGVIVGLISIGSLAPSAPLAVFPTAFPRPTTTPDPSQVVTIDMIYSTEKEEWLETSVDAWVATNPTVDGRPIQVRLRDSGSQEMVTNLEQGTIQPVVISPASSSQISQINTTLQNIASDSQPLLFTPLVIIAWNGSTGPASQLENTDDLWETIHDIALENFSKRTFLFSQTDPSASNSGLQTFTLMAYAYHNKTSGLTVSDIQDPGFRQWITEYARNIERFGNSTGTLIQDMIRFGPSRYNAIAAYESSALEYMDNASNRWGELRMIYPEQNLWSDHPFAILDAEWVEPVEQQAATMFRDFLLSDERQTAAMQLGFRPTNPNVTIDSPDSPWNQYQQYGVQTQINQLVEEPSGEVITALLELWNELAPQVNR